MHGCPRSGTASESKWGLDAFLQRCRIRVDALNHALKGIATEQIRYHMCWGSWHGPHAYDLELKHLVGILLNVNAGAYLIEGANARHEHEWAVWQDVKLRDGKILIPGVVTHSTDIVEHPELVSQRLQRYAKLVGRENLIAGCDCESGCPMCVGPIGETGPLAKTVALRILEHLLAGSETIAIREEEVPF